MPKRRNRVNYSAYFILQSGHFIFAMYPHAHTAGAFGKPCPFCRPIRTLPKPLPAFGFASESYRQK
ncbi:hypothetical protein, partial [Neisseria dentiae]|uniref:hypothetical protein n=2 Tax=Neisseria TaxID=482 RepID=UPI0035A0FA92